MIAKFQIPVTEIKIATLYSQRTGSQPLILLCDLLQLGTQPGRDQLATSISIICAQNID